MNWRQWLRVAIGSIVIGAAPGWVVFGLIDLDDAVQAPLLAVVAAMGLSVTAGARADQTWERVFNGGVLFMTITAAAFSALRWLVAADASLGITLLGGVGATLAVAVFVTRLGDEVGVMTKEHDRGNGGR